MPAARQGIHILVTHTASESGIYAVVRKMSQAGFGDYWTGSAFETTPTGGAELLAMAETATASGAYYLAVNELADYTGAVSVIVYDSSNVAIDTAIWYLVNGQESQFQVLMVVEPVFTDGSNDAVYGQFSVPESVTIATSGSSSIIATDDSSDAVPVTIIGSTFYLTPVGDEAYIDVVLQATVDSEANSVTQRIYPRSSAVASSSVSAVANVHSSRTFKLNGRGDSVAALNHVTLDNSDTATLAWDFRHILNSQTVLESVTAVIEESANAITITEKSLSQSRLRVHCKVGGLTENTTSTIRATAVTSDGQTISGIGTLVVE